MRWVVDTIVLLNLVGPLSADGDSLALHRDVASRLPGLLPPPLTTLLNDASTRFSSGVVEPATEWPRDTQLKQRNDWHHIEGDLEAGDSAQAARLKAFDVFPRDETDAGRLYRRKGRHIGGALPWALLHCHAHLVEAFRAGNHDDAVSWAGHLTHFATDAANPFRCSVDSEGTSDANLALSPTRGVHPPSTEGTIRQRFDTLMSRINHIAPSLDLESDRAAPHATVPVDMVFQMLRDSIAVLHTVSDADARTLADLEIVNRKSFEEKRNAYYSLMVSRCGRVALDRVNAATLLASRLITAAWNEAGSPALVLNSSTAIPSTQTDTGLAPFVASRHSEIFHKQACSSAANIKDENRVGFPTAQAARNSGRRPCKRCRPE